MLSVVPDQLQGERGVLDVAVGKQQQVPRAARRRQQAESPQGLPQLGAAPLWEKTLRGGRGAELSPPGVVSFSIYWRRSKGQGCIICFIHTVNAKCQISSLLIRNRLQIVTKIAILNNFSFYLICFVKKSFVI